MKTGKQKIILAAKILSVLFLALIIAFYLFRDAVLRQTIAKVSNEMEIDYNSTFSVKKASFDGISGVNLSDIVLVPKNADTLFKIQKLKTSVNLWQLAVGNLQLGTLEIKNGFIQLVKKGKVRNFDAFLKKDNQTEINNEKRDYAQFTYRIISKALNLVPTDMVLDNLSFRLNDNEKKATINFQKLRLVNKQLETSIKVQTNTFTQRWKIKGFADPRNKKADIRFVNIDTGAIKVPYFDERYNLKSSFDSIRLNIQNIDKDGDELHIDGFMAITNLKINHQKIASKDVILKNAKFDYRFLLGSDFISIDSTSTVQFNKIKFHPYLAYETEEDTIYKLKVAIPKMKAQDFISSLPDGLFTHFQGMEANGNFDYKLDFMFNKNKPNQLVFDSKLNKENLKITKYGEANLNKLNGEFVYRALIKNVLQRPVLVGSVNPNYTPLYQISPYLRKCVLTTEDPSFFSHRGFINEAFKQSIVKNIKTKKFSRGASTISMQLVKNVFLSREKTVSRKLEEILLVYILENNRIVSKERMLEVYFNIIEWGPDVYGIGEASRFYFQKAPSELSLNECLYLARIIPSPKKFMYQFNDQGMLKDFAIKQESFLTNIMFRRGLLSPDDTIYKSLPILISGPAKSFIKFKVQDSMQIKVDSLVVDEEFDL
ncbi:transglycosylase domain-containing protein [Flavobacterium gawalongense]|uniref:Glycosyl transferase n=1 Tax=Flavobacterium gawalongense TaxID=2594432 RepID=A0A553BW21_9FLAO|nr:biosynthetic peptidoglycan transglycosylase [Flavobacterium gawalongense]TRX02072.1 glycosyl transferase [Flavobacterium gawalongense]TRX06600.1 glycosyl transferase [Flavobacterium gawalongense]TRX12471.1 glycosyl transferase [Flavobacterium gawalongense]TRX12708.1 glycosyl transferase [Flavobacterium gawalongense]TRX30503.1 glycosyl transferase [Flavobacterium gawalongense]